MRALAGRKAVPASRTAQAAVPVTNSRLARRYSGRSPRGQQPQYGQYREQHRRGDGERCSARAACLGDAGADRGEHQDLQEERAAAAGVVTAVQLVVQAAVGPGDPHQREHHGELAEPGPGQVQGQVAGGLRDQYDHGQVVEQFEWADRALARLVAVRAGWLPQRAAQPGPAISAGGCAGSGSGHWLVRQVAIGRVSIQLTISRRSANSHESSCLANSSR